MSESDRDELAREAWRHLSRLLFGPEQFERVHEVAQSLGLPHPGSLKALLSIPVDDPPSMRELALRMRCDASYITALVDSLEGVGYVERRPHPTDRRIKLVALTPHGAAVQERAGDELARPPASIERLTDAEVRSLARIARKLA